MFIMRGWVSLKQMYPTSAKCTSALKQDAILSDTPGDLTSASKYFLMLQTPVELSKVLSDSAWAFSGAPECTFSYGAAFRMLQDLTYTIVEFWRWWDLCPELRESSTRAGSATHLCAIPQEQPSSLCSSAGDLMLHSHCSDSYITTRYFILSYLALLHSQDSLYHHMACVK